MEVSYNWNIQKPEVSRLFVIAIHDDWMSLGYLFELIPWISLMFQKKARGKKPQFVAIGYNPFRSQESNGFFIYQQKDSHASWEIYIYNNQP